MKDHTFTIIDARQKAPKYLYAMIAKWAAFSAILFGPGIVSGSVAMQWAGFVIILIGGISFSLTRRRDGMTIAQARAKLDEMERGKGYE